MELLRKRLLVLSTIALMITWVNANPHTTRTSHISGDISNPESQPRPPGRDPSPKLLPPGRESGPKPRPEDKLRETIDSILKATNATQLNVKPGELNTPNSYPYPAVHKPGRGRIVPGISVGSNTGLQPGGNTRYGVPNMKPPRNEHDEKIISDRNNHEKGDTDILNKNTHNHGETSSNQGGKNGYSPPDRSVFVYNSSYAGPGRDGATVEGKVLTGTSGTVVPKGDLCQFCLCNDDSPFVACIHRHREENALHSMELDLSMIPTGKEDIEIKDYDSVLVSPDTFSQRNSTLKSITFSNIKKLILKRSSFYFDQKADKNMKVTLAFEDSYIPKLPTGAITQMLHGNHDDSYSYKREKTRYLDIAFLRCRIDSLESMSLSRAVLVNLNMTNSTVSKIEPKSIDVKVTDLCKFSGNQLPDLPEDAICLHAKTSVFSFNTIQTMAKKSIEIETESQVLFEHNTIEFLKEGALAGIEPLSGKYGPSLVFRNNVLKRVESGSLMIDPSFSTREPAIHSNSFHIFCSCNMSKGFHSLLAGEEGDMHHSEQSFKINFRSSRCLEEKRSAYVVVDTFLEGECRPFPVVIVSAVGVAVLLFIVAIVVCVVCSVRMQRVKEEANMLGDCTSQSFSTLSRNYYTDTLHQKNYPCDEVPYPSSPTATTPFAMTPWSVGVPEVKTYQQNQTPEFTERTESIAGSIRSRERSSKILERNLERSRDRKKESERASCPFN